jgi:hypothetical protein
VPGLSADFPEVLCNADDVCLMTTGMGHANAAASTMALLFSRQLDLRRSYIRAGHHGCGTLQRAERSSGRRKPLETQFGYGRIDKLLGDGVRHGGIIEEVACFDVYGSLLAQFAELGFTQNGNEKRIYSFPYDWRQDLEPTAKALAGKLDSVHNDGAQEIHLIAHSMGGLISRLVLETGTFADRPWFKKIAAFIAMATPIRVPR